MIGSAHFALPVTLQTGLVSGRALGSVVEHRLHTAGVSGSNPLAPTIFSHSIFPYWLSPVDSACLGFNRYGTEELWRPLDFTSTCLPTCAQVAVGMYRSSQRREIG